MWDQQRMAMAAVVIVTILGGCRAQPAPGGSAAGDDSSGAGVPTDPATKRVLAAIRGAPASLVLTKTASSVAGLDGLELLVHAGLTQFTDQDAVRPQLAEAVPSLENGLWKVLPDGRMETTWRIRDTSRWHDGVPVSSADLMFTMDVEQDREVGLLRSGVYDLIDGADAPDPRTIVVRWKQPFIDADATFSQALALPMPRHLLERSFREDKVGFLAIPYWSRDFVGAGPFKVREWVMDSHVVLEANDAYVLGRPKVQEIEVRFIPDANTMLANVLAGAVEVWLGRGLDFQQGVELAEQWKGGTVRWHSTGWFKVSPQFVDPRPPIVADLRFRRALMHGTHRQELADTFTGGLAPIADTLVPLNAPEFKGIESSIIRYEYEPRRSAQIIESLGYTRGADGVFRDSSGQRLAVEVRTTVGLPIQANITFALADSWKQLGMDVETIPISVQQMRDREYRASFPGFEMVSNNISLTARDIERWRSSNAPLPENRFQITGNDPRYKNAVFDALIDRYVTTIPKDERLAALAGIVRHQTEQLPLMGLFYTLNPSLNAHRLQNVTARFARTNEAWNAHEWAIK